MKYYIRLIVNYVEQKWKRDDVRSVGNRIVPTTDRLSWLIFGFCLFGIVFISYKVFTERKFEKNSPGNHKYFLHSSTLYASLRLSYKGIRHGDWYIMFVCLGRWTNTIKSYIVTCNYDLIIVNINCHEPNLLISIPICILYIDSVIRIVLW
jgi:hypothetical protein